MKIKLQIFCWALLLLSGCANFPSFNRDCHEVGYKLVDGNFWVEVTKYGSPKNKSLIIVPPTGGTNYIDRRYADYFCEAGYEVIVLDRWMGQSEPGSFDLGMHQRFYERADRAIAMGVAESKAKFIGLLGTSVGALHASVAAGTQNRINAVFIITGGAPIAGIIVNSDQQAMVDLAKKRVQEFGYKSKEEYLAALTPKIKLDPMLVGPGFKNKKLGMMIALDDYTVPTEFQNKLADYWKPAVVLERNTGHFWGIVDTFLFDKDKVLEFFESTFK